MEVLFIYLFLGSAIKVNTGCLCGLASKQSIPDRYRSFEKRVGGGDFRDPGCLDDGVGSSELSLGLLSCQCQQWKCRDRPYKQPHLDSHRKAGPRQLIRSPITTDPKSFDRSRGSSDSKKADCIKRITPAIVQGIQVESNCICLLVAKHSSMAISIRIPQ